MSNVANIFYYFKIVLYLILPFSYYSYGCENGVILSSKGKNSVTAKSYFSGETNVGISLTVTRE